MRYVPTPLQVWRCFLNRGPRLESLITNAVGTISSHGSDARDVALSATSSARYNSYSWLLLRKYSVPTPSALWITSLMLFKEQQLSVIEQIRNCNRSLAIVGAWHSPPCYTYQCAHIQADVDRYLQSVYWSGCARSIFGFPPPLRRAN